MEEDLEYYTVITYDASGVELSCYRGAVAVGEDTAKQWMRNSLDLEGTVRSAVFVGQFESTPDGVTPDFTLTQEEAHE